VNGKVLVYSLQILDGDGKISTVMGMEMGDFLWGWGGDGNNLTR